MKLELPPVIDYAATRKIIANKCLMEHIMAKTSFLDEEFKKVPLRQRLWHISNATDNIVKCATCQESKVRWTEKTSEYYRYCSSKCAHQNQEVKTKTKETCMLRYGVTTTLLDTAVKERIKNSLIKNYGVDNPFKSKTIQDKITNTCIDRYGVANPAKSQVVQDRIDETHFRRYGRKRSSQTHIPMDIVELKNSKAIMKDWYENQKMPIQEIAEVLGVNTSQLCVHFRDNLQIDISRHSVSRVEREITSMIQSLGVEVVTSDRTLIAPREVDILIPSKQLAIEVDGLAWHTELRGKSRSYHLQKTIDVKSGGYDLIHVTDYEWATKRKIVESRLAAKLGASSRVYARKTNIVKLPAQLASEFMLGVHIQGACAHSVAYGLEHDGKLVAVMTFGKARYSKKVQWELLRYASALGVSVVGGASKLFKQFINDHHPVTVISYADRRWNTGNLYNQLGFTHIRDSGPNYWYTKQYRSFESRIKYQKHKLPKLLSEFDATQTEWENMIANGYDRYWDCGNSVWLWEGN